MLGLYRLEMKGEPQPMKRTHTTLSIVLIAGALMLFPAVIQSQDQTAPAQKKAVQQAPAEEQQEYTEEEYDAYDKAVKEPDLDKRADLLFGFIDKYPKSKLMVYIDRAYQELVFNYEKEQKWDKLEPLAERWLKIHPDDFQSIVYVAEAAQKLGQDQKFLEYGEKVYATKPTPGMAYYISQAYKKVGNQDKYLEWTQKLFSYPEYDSAFGLRMVFVEKYQKENKLDKAAEYARLALKSLDAAKRPDSTPEAKWKEETRAVRRACLFTVGLDYVGRKNCPQAIKYLQETLKIEQVGAAYFYIGQCQWHSDSIPEAMNSFAKCATLKGEFATQAKDSLEKLYKALHNNTLVGIEKVYTKAEKELAQEKPAAP
jgi:hypothetical protein